MYTTIQEMVNSMKGKRGEELDKEKYRMLIAEYKAFKENNVQHFRFDSSSFSNFGKFYCISFLAALAALYLPLVRITVRNRWITVRNRWITVRNRRHFRIWAQIVTFETFVRNDD